MLFYATKRMCNHLCITDFFLIYLHSVIHLDLYENVYSYIILF